ncbi:unnamed protein product [Diabrotica balteata]|uniref:Uncharacterized protein n=1 Tax=Diabrotica balteata TaxID=107213 RepID=A0A9N9XAB2_DIABA|nr:unnamed protein product [Diabrotica balteata]
MDLSRGAIDDVSEALCRAHGGIRRCIDPCLSPQETGTFQLQVAGNSGRLIMDATDIDILEVIEEVPGTSTRVIAAQLNVPHVWVWRRLKDQLLKSYHLTTVQELLVEDYPKRIGFCDCNVVLIV